MKRRKFIQSAALLGGAATCAPLAGFHSTAQTKKIINNSGRYEYHADFVVAGGGLGGCAAALAALRNDLTVILTEETDWIGGQLTSQGVPPDEHRWIETHGATALYRELRTRIRNYYRQNYSLTDEARAQENLNPGSGAVSRLCAEPRVVLSVLQDMMAPHISSGRLTLLTQHKVTAADVTGNRVNTLKAVSLQSGREIMLSAQWFADATELGDLLPMTGTEYITGAESRLETGELHAHPKGDPDNHQSFTVCFAMDYIPGTDNLIEKPAEYDFWRDHVPDLTPPWPGRLLDLTYTHPPSLQPRKLGFHPEGIRTGDTLNLWVYRRIINKSNFIPDTYKGDITVVNWPQNDYMLGNLTDDFNYHFERGKQLSRSLFYWLQTEVPRPEGGYGWPGLRLRGDIMGTEDGMAKYPYVRESRRIKAEFTVLEEHVGTENRKMITGKNEETGADFFDTVGIGYYHIDLHPSSRNINYIDFPSLPFQIPLGSLLPVRMENLLPANKNTGTTHITNGCYRLHPVEWNIGESAGMLVAWSKIKKVIPRAVRENNKMLAEFQNFIRSQGIETHWRF